MMVTSVESSDVGLFGGAIIKKDILLNLSVVLSVTENSTPNAGKGIVTMLARSRAHV